MAQRATRQLELRCRSCSWQQVCGPTSMMEWLGKLNKVRAGRMPELEILYELFTAMAPQFTCPGCSRQSLVVSAAADDRAAWPGEVLCASCGRPISPERLKAAAGATRCAACQGDFEQGKRHTPKDYCPRCGAPLEVRAVERDGRTRYILACSAVPPCPLS